ncbi:MAG: 50S ribosomal protein L4 [Verrucomicrobiota bacterium]
MAATVLTEDVARKAKIELAEAGKGDRAVHQLMTTYRANRRSGSANTKTRGEVSATGKKPFRQKGTGRARAGGNASPIQRGGGVVFGPRPRDYSKKMPKGMRRLAFRRALSARIASEDVIMVDAFVVADGKTKRFVQELSAITDEGPVLIIGDQFEESTYLAGRNYQDALLTTAADVNAEQVLSFGKIVITEGALEGLAKRTAK